MGNPFHSSLTGRRNLIVSSLRTTGALLGILAFLLAVGIAWMSWTHRDRRIATLAGPDGSPDAYEIWWDPYGDLWLVDLARGRVAGIQDYYADLRLISLDWQSDQEAVLTTVDGVRLTVVLEPPEILADFSGYQSSQPTRTLTKDHPTTALSESDLLAPSAR